MLLLAAHSPELFTKFSVLPSSQCAHSAFPLVIRFPLAEVAVMSRLCRGCDELMGSGDYNRGGHGLLVNFSKISSCLLAVCLSNLREGRGVVQPSRAVGGGGLEQWHRHRWRCTAAGWLQSMRVTLVCHLCALGYGFAAVRVWKGWAEKVAPQQYALGRPISGQDGPR